MADRPEDEGRRNLSQRLSEGGWLLYTIELLVLVVIFGWMFLTYRLAA